MSKPKDKNMKNRNNLARSKFHRDFRAVQSKVLSENSEYKYDESGEIVGKAPNLKNVKKFYKKVRKHIRMHGRNGKKWR